MSSLQIGLIVAGVLLVIGVIVYNAWQERRLRREAARQSVAAASDMRMARNVERVEPTLAGQGAATHDGTAAFRPGHAHETDFEPPLEVIPPSAQESPHVAAQSGVSSPSMRASMLAEPEAVVDAAAELSAPRIASAPRQAVMPDYEIECLIPLHPAAPVPAGAVSNGLHARVGKPLRWFGRPDARSDWQPLASDTPGRFGDIVACMLLADRNGPVSRAQLDNFIRVVGDIAPALPSPFTPPDIGQELARAEALDQLCAEIDLQIGLTVQIPDPGSIPGTRLRGVAEASGLRLASGGRFEYVHEETGAVLYTLQNLRPDPFTAESLRLTATNGVVFLLDVARLSDPVRGFDQMKMAAKRMAKTLGGELVDDNHRPLDDAALAAIREQVAAATQALRDAHIEPGGARALALFSA